MTLNLPKYIALCGYSGAGKSEVQKILRADFDVLPVDDGWPLRDYAIRHMGATEAQVFTQEGKTQLAWINGAPVIDHVTGSHMTWRQVLGRIGDQLEALMGTHHMAQCAMLRTELMPDSNPYKHFSFGSVRKDQAGAYKLKGGLVIGIKAPWAPWNENAFDLFDESAVDLWIENSVKDLEVLRKTIAAAIGYISFQRQIGGLVRGTNGPNTPRGFAFDTVA